MDRRNFIRTVAGGAAAALGIALMPKKSKEQINREVVAMVRDMCGSRRRQDCLLHDIYFPKTGVRVLLAEDGTFIGHMQSDYTFKNESGEPLACGTPLYFADKTDMPERSRDC